MAVAFPFPREFQRSILRLLLCDREAFLSLRSTLDATYFTDEVQRWIAQAAFGVYDKTSDVPSQPSVLQATEEGCPGGLDPSEVEAEVRALYEDGKPDDSRHVRDRVTDFARHQRLRSAVAESEEMLATGQYDALVAKINEANLVDDGGANNEFDYNADLIDRLGSLDATYGESTPTGILSLDRNLDGYGLGKGEMGILLALPGYHKTNFLINFGKHAVSMGKQVAHVTLEVSARKVAIRYDCLISEMTKSDILLHRKDARVKIAKWMAETGGSLRIAEWPTQSCTLAMLEGKIQRWITRDGWTPDLLLVDYGALLKPDHDHDGAIRLQHGSLYKGLRRIAGTYSIPVWTAQQAGREGAKVMEAGGVITMMNAAETFEPIRDADVVITLNQTEKEKRDGVLRAFGAKTRENASGWESTLRVDASRSTIVDYGHVSKGEGEGAASDDDDDPPPPPRGE